MVNDDRGQLILVGSIAIAIVLIGLTFVLNSAVFTENVAGGSSVEVTGDISEFDREAGRNVRSLSVRINHGHAYPNDTDGRKNLTADLRENVSAYSGLLAKSYADTGSVYVNISLGETQNGTRIVQRNDSDFSKPNGDPDWALINGPSQLGWFVVNLDAKNVTDATSIVITNSTHTLEVNILPNGTRDGLDVTSSINPPVGSLPERGPCYPQNGRVLIDVMEGTQYSDFEDRSETCSFTSARYLDPPYTEIRFENGNNVRGKYDIVVSDAAATQVSDSCKPSNQDQPCSAAAIWSVEFTTHHQTGSIDYDNTHNVTVYDE